MSLPTGPTPAEWEEFEKSIPNPLRCATCGTVYTASESAEGRCGSVEHICGSCQQWSLTCADCVEKAYTAVLRTQETFALRGHDQLYPDCGTTKTARSGS